MPTRLTILLSLVLAGLPAAPCRAQEPWRRPPLVGEAAATLKRIADADTLANAGRWPEAVAEYARILEEAGSDLVPLSEHHSLRAAWLLNLRLAAAPAEAVRSYRTRLDGPARAWYEAGASTRDPAPLQRIVEEAFCSHHTEKALELLGDLSFERGDFDQAAAWWRHLVLPASVPDGPTAGAPAAGAPAGKPPQVRALPADPGNLPPLLVPDPPADPARHRARLVLALIFAGRTDAARAELEAFRRRHPGAAGPLAGPLAGQAGDYAATLERLLARPPRLADAADDWPTFGGGSARGRRLPPEPADPNRLLRLAREGPTYRFRLATREPAAPERPARPPRPPRPPQAGPTPPVTGRLVPDRLPPDRAVPPAELARALAFHPIIAEGHALVADARGVTAVELASGTARTWDLATELGADPARLGLVLSLPAPPDLRYTLTAGDGRVYARLGTQVLAGSRRGPAAESYLVCLDLESPDGRLKSLGHRKLAGANPDETAAFEGAPVVADGRVWIAVTRLTGPQAATAVHCYPAGLPANVPPLWTQDVALSRDDASRGPRYRHQLLTLAGRHVVLATHTGVVAALDARTGRRAWAFHYPSRTITTPGGAPVPRDLAPPVYADGRLYVAPADSDRLYCLDPETGALLWERERLEVVHLLGVGSGRLIFSTPRTLRAVRADDGTDRGGWQRPEFPDDLGLPSWGRGFLAGGLVFWPTVAGVKVLNQDDGAVPDDFIPLSAQVLLAGNMAWADGCLAVATEQDLALYVAGRSPLAAPRGHAETPGKGDLAPLVRQARAASSPDEAQRAWLAVQAAAAPGSPAVRDARGLPQSPAVAAARALAGLAAARAGAPGPERPERDPPSPSAPPVQATVPSAHPLAPAAPVSRLMLRCWQTPRDAEESLVCPEPSQGSPLGLLFQRDGRLVARDPATGAELWRSAVPFAPTWSAAWADRLLLGGPAGAAALHRGDGRTLWTFLPGPLTPYPDVSLSSFALAGGRLLALLGRGCLLALDPASGCVAWSHEAPSVRLDPSLPDASLLIHLAGESLLLARTAGRSWVLDPRDGRTVHRFPAGVPGPDLLPLGDAPGIPPSSRAVWIEDGTRVVAHDLAHGRPLWEHSIPWSSTSTGQPASLLAARGPVLVLVPRNHGTFLRQLDPLTGRLIGQEVFLDSQHLPARAVHVDARSVVFASGGLLTARSLEGGSLWQLNLPDVGTSWALASQGRDLLAVPSGQRLAWRITALGATLEWDMTRAPEDRPGSGFPVLLVDPRTGQVLQRLNLPALPPRPLGPVLSASSPGGRPGIRAWREDASGPRALALADGLVVSWLGQAWAYRPPLPPQAGP